ncbi:heparanase-like [Galleria mellonella]|uniref:Heparanase-like n=1 Tax=Galleria mellonella TaxID=7137 RepID=A0ABM3MJ47_GALME|nr:heparanase-like [Galleria mellonella]
MIRLFHSGNVHIVSQNNKMLSNKRLVAICAIVFSCNVALLVLFVKYHTGNKCFVTINEHQKVIAYLPDDFLSVGIDTSEIQDYDSLDFKKTKLRDLAAALAPARLRLGGTMSERLIFSQQDIIATCQHCPNHHSSICAAVKKLCRHKFLPFFILTGNKWDEINEFCKAVNLKLLFSLNALIRDEHGWNDVNAKELLQYSKSKNYDIDWQLGNEPNSYHHVFNITVTPHVLAHDFKKLRMLLNNFGFNKSLLVGPDTTQPRPEQPQCLKYMVEFLGNGSHSINVTSWHHYYLNSRTAKLDDFWNPDTFDLLKDRIQTMRRNTEEYAQIPMWLSETSSSYGGGAPGLSNSYAASPLWVDKLGLSAQNNITTVIRQSFFGGNYSLIDKDLEPLPDWWISILFKKLVGNKVLHVDCHCSRYQRMYAHCANRNYTNDTTAITIYAVNLEMAKPRFLLNGSALHGDNLYIDEYILSAPSNNRRTKTVLLNGWPLYYDSALPELEPRKIRYGNHISLPPYSIGFWVIQNTSIDVCK